MAAVKVTYYFSDDASTYSNVSDWDIEDCPELIDNSHIGDWEYPFPNEPGNSLAFGLWECFVQSHVGYALIERHGRVIRIKVEDGE